MRRRDITAVGPDAFPPVFSDDDGGRCYVSATLRVQPPRGFARDFSPSSTSIIVRAMEYPRENKGTLSVIRQRADKRDYDLRTARDNQPILGSAALVRHSISHSSDPFVIRPCGHSSADIFPRRQTMPLAPLKMAVA